MSWNLRECTAKWDGQPWSIGVDLASELSQPLIQIYDGTKQPVLAIALTPSEQHTTQTSQGIPLGEAYVRQKDLIAMFPESAPWRFGYQVDLRGVSLDLPDRLVLEIWLSVQTSLLDSHPQLELQLRGESFKLSVDDCWTSESSRLGLLLHPLDRLDCQIEPTKDGLAMRVFGRFMEKGVIRRMRFQLIANQQSQPARYWHERFEEFSDSPLPLTT